jgi:hypothetical protein
MTMVSLPDAALPPDVRKGAAFPHITAAKPQKLSSR